ncbi:MAG: 2-amino-4-hydroxy-6-hydroxymethyldihydropteridine diphosphokinase [Bacteroidaceae bacterium]|nr:2-amino-4-hydroxy-6-hydroxymethyldihydropteridine diphosphokinase [Bacteroidaceae bacterium]
MQRRTLHRVFFALGSNTDQPVHMRLARQYLMSLFQEVHFSTEAWTKAIGIDSEPFLNCMGMGFTTHERTQIERALKQIQRRCGDSKGKRRLNKIVMDIDLMQYDGERYHEEDWERDYIQHQYKELLYIDNTRT